MPKEPSRALTRRETEILNILHTAGRATAAEVQERLPDPPGYSAVRKLLELLEKKGLVAHEVDGRRFVYRAAKTKVEASQSALTAVVNTFFAGSVEQAVAALLSSADREVSEASLKRVIEASRRAKERGK